jgi:hypothetical protein
MQFCQQALVKGKSASMICRVTISSLMLEVADSKCFQEDHSLDTNPL